MKIASFCFHLKKEEVGGAQVPAIAFKKWCDILNVDCDLVGMGDNFSEDIPVPIINIEDESELNEYDAVFFSTPGKITISPFNFDKVTAKKAVMFHAEFDNRIYPAFSECAARKDMKKIVIGKKYWGFKQELLWYPCCLPEYLLTEDIVSKDTYFNNEDRSGLIYQARLSSWKNSNMLAFLSKSSNFKESVENKIDIVGNFNNENYSEFVNDIKPDISIENKIYNGYDFQNKRYLSGYNWFWDVSGTPLYKLNLKRFNLSAVEAMRFGCVPIIKKDSLFFEAQKFSIDYEEIFHNTKLLGNISQNASRYHMAEVLLDETEYNYNSVMKQISNIIEELS